MYTLMNAVPPGPNRPNVNMNLVIFFSNYTAFFYPNHCISITPCPF